MGKPASSSISKAKRSKRSSQGRIKKRSKTKRSKSKKLRRRDDSDSYSEGSRNSGSVSSSRSDDSHRGRRSRSRGRKDAKGSKKRSRARSSSSEDSRRGRKERRSKRKDGSQERKRTRGTNMKRKKKIKRDASINSRSSGCSTCESPSNISGESKYERHRGRSKTRENGERREHIEIERERIGNRVMRRRNGSSDSFNEETVSHKNAPIRLKSVITSAAEDKEVRELVKDELKEEMIYDHDEDELKEEMIYDHDDYPSSRSNDSNDEGDKRESAHQLHAASEKRRPLQDEKRGNAPIPYSRTTKLTETNYEKEGQSVGDKKDNHWNGINDAILDKKNEVFEGVGGLNSDDLESILRKKALENLKRFHGGPLRSQTSAKSSINEKDTSDRTIKQPPTKMRELSQIRSPICDPVPKISSQYDDSGVVPGDSTQSSHIGEKIPYKKNGDSESWAAKNIDCPPDLVGNSRKNITATVGSGIKRPRLVASALRQALSNTSTSSKIVHNSSGSDEARPVTGTSVGGSSVQSTHVVTSLAPTGNVGDTSVQNPHAVMPLAPTGNVGESSLQSPHAVMPLPPTGNIGESSVPSPHAVMPLAPTGIVDKVKNDVDPPSAEPSSSLAPASSSLAPAGGDVISSKLQDEVKDGSQLEQKTMSVMRGGELVQVSYKVYIPKKVPALARRQLKR